MFNTRMAFIIIGSSFLMLDAQSMGEWYAQHATMQAYQDQDMSHAQATYAAIVKEHPLDPRINFNEGCLLYKQADYAGAVAIFERATQHKDSLDEEEQEQLFFNLGNAYAYQKQWQQAIDAYDNVLELDASH